MTESCLTATLKSSGAHDAAWLVVRADNPVELQGYLDAISSNGLGVVLASADEAFKAAFTVGKGLGAEPVAAPQNPAPQPDAPAQQENPWAAQQPAQQVPPADSNPWGVPAQQAAQPAGAANTFGGGGGEAGAPMVLGMPARKVSKVSPKTGKPWSAWADPRPQEAVAHIPKDAKTDDPNDPRLAQGTATFWQFIRN